MYIKESFIKFHWPMWSTNRPIDGSFIWLIEVYKVPILYFSTSIVEIVDNTWRKSAPVKFDTNLVMLLFTTDNLRSLGNITKMWAGSNVDSGHWQSISVVTVELHTSKNNYYHQHIAQKTYN